MISFVPVFVPPPRPPSAQARELSRRLTETIEHFEREHPGTRPEDVRRALALASALGRSAASRILTGMLVMGTIVGLVLLLALLR